MLVLGQEQDHRGGGYSPQESFVGQLTLVNVWAELLSPGQILRTFTRCDRYIGSLVGWPDFQWGIKGQVEVSARLCVSATSAFVLHCCTNTEGKNHQVKLSLLLDCIYIDLTDFFGTTVKYGFACLLHTISISTHTRKRSTQKLGRGAEMNGCQSEE